MLNSDILEVAIGIIFVFILVSIICSAVREAIEAWFKTRGAYLERGIRELLRDGNGTDLAAALYEHPLISGLYAGKYEPGATPDEPTARPSYFARGKNLPSYIPSRNVAQALMDLAARGPVRQFSAIASQIEVNPQTIRANLYNIPSPAIQRVLLNALDTAQGDLEAVRKEIEKWFDSGMDRVSGWYKRATHWILFWIGLVVAIFLNVNTITIADYLFRHPAERATIVAQAEDLNRQNQAGQTVDVRQARALLDSVRLPIGWDGSELFTPPARGDSQSDMSYYSAVGWNYVSPLLGWLITAFAATLGAPFWFDVLNKVMVIRSTVKPHEKSPEEASKDNQKPKPTPGAAGGEPLAGAGDDATRNAAGTDSQTGAGTGAGTGTSTGAQPQSQPQQPGGGGGGGGDAPQTGGAAPEAPTAAELEGEGCEIPTDRDTPDEELPASEGGVA